MTVYLSVRPIDRFKLRINCVCVISVAKCWFLPYSVFLFSTFPEPSFITTLLLRLPAKDLHRFALTYLLKFTHRPQITTYRGEIAISSLAPPNGQTFAVTESNFLIIIIILVGSFSVTVSQFYPTYEIPSQFIPFLSFSSEWMKFTSIFSMTISLSWVFPHFCQWEEFIPFGSLHGRIKVYLQWAPKSERQKCKLQSCEYKLQLALGIFLTYKIKLVKIIKMLRNTIQKVFRKHFGRKNVSKNFVEKFYCQKWQYKKAVAIRPTSMIADLVSWAHYLLGNSSPLLSALTFLMTIFFLAIYYCYANQYTFWHDCPLTSFKLWYYLLMNSNQTWSIMVPVQSNIPVWKYFSSCAIISLNALTTELMGLLRLYQVSIFRNEENYH